MCSQVQTKEFAWAVCNVDMGHNYASTSGNFKAISSSSLSFGGGQGEKGGCQIQSVINEHFKYEYVLLRCALHL